MEQDRFIAILRRYLQGNATAAEKKLIDVWYASMKGNVSEHDVPAEEDLEEYYRKAIQPHIKKSNLGDNLKRFLPWYAAGIAASLLVAISTYFFFTGEIVNEKEMAAKKEMAVVWKQIANSASHQQIIILPDSSEVVLQPGSNLKYSPGFNNTNREIYLEGEAAFNVTYNPNLPFLVYANEVTTKVLGTSFVIRALKHEQRITVVVKTGKVSVYTNPDSEKKSASANEIILTPNQQIVYDKNHHEISKSLVEKPRVILPQEEVRRMRFEDAPVREIFKALEKAYGVDIEFDEKIFSSCELTTVISDDDIYSRLDIICDALGTSYTRQQDRIVISSSGCKTKF
jgi:ferric-dicitrate binding protein FerR (iron transport regulator)